MSESLALEGKAKPYPELGTMSGTEAATAGLRGGMGGECRGHPPGFSGSILTEHHIDLSLRLTSNVPDGDSSWAVRRATMTEWTSGAKGGMD